MSSDIPIESTSSDLDFEQCLADFETQHEEYCEGLLHRHLNGGPGIDIYNVPADSYRPDPFKYTRGNAS